METPDDLLPRLLALAGRDRVESVRTLRSLREALESIETRHAVRRQAGQCASDPYLWLALARAHHEADETLQALRSWNHLRQLRLDSLDPDRLAALGMPDANAWQALAQAMHRRKSEWLRDAYADIRRSHASRETFRIDRALVGYLGEATVLPAHPAQRPKLIYVPGLGGDGFLDPAKHPLVPPLLDSFRALREDFDVALEARDGIQPFLGTLAGVDRSRYLSGSLDAAWDALFFFRHGRRFDDNHERFPRTSAVLDSLDLCRIDSQAPEICFSILRPHTRIEPHHGVTNARVVIHIPLRVPPGCHLDITGVGRHDWREGEPMVFDDTFEHSADNPTDQARGILLMDAWHPGLTPVERTAFRALVEALTQAEAAPWT